MVVSKERFAVAKNKYIPGIMHVKIGNIISPLIIKIIPNIIIEIIIRIRPQ